MAVSREEKWYPTILRAICFVFKKVLRVDVFNGIRRQPDESLRSIGTNLAHQVNITWPLKSKYIISEIIIATSICPSENIKKCLQFLCIEKNERNMYPEKTPKKYTDLIVDNGHQKTCVLV